MSPQRQLLEARRLDFARRMEQEPFDYRSWCVDYGVSKATIFHWRAQYLSAGREGLKATKPTGRPSRLTADQQEHIQNWLLDHQSEGWSSQQVRNLIGEQYGVWYHPDHIWRLLRGWGWVCHLL